jgi:hypothetical protein
MELKAFEEYCSLPTTPLKYVKLTAVGRLMDKLRDDLDTGDLSLPDVRKLFTADGFEELFRGYCLEGDVSLAYTTLVKKELHDLCDQFVKYMFGDSESETEDDATPGGVASQVEGTRPELSDDVRKLIDIINKDPNVRFLDGDAISKTFLHPSLNLTPMDWYTMLTAPSQAGKIVDLMVRAGVITQVDKMRAKVDVSYALNTFATRHGRFCKPPTGETSSIPAASSQPTHTTSTVQAGPSPVRAGDPKKHSATLHGFLAFCKERNEGKPLLEKATSTSPSIPDWEIFTAMLAPMSIDECVDTLVQDLELNHAVAEKVAILFKEFYAAHQDEVDVDQKKYLKRHAAAKDSDDESDNPTVTPRETNRNTTATKTSPAKKPEPCSDDSDDGQDVAFVEGYTGARYMTREEGFQAYLAGHPELKDNPRRNKNLDFYRGALAMLPYKCFITDFHRRPETETVSQAKEEAEADSLPTAAPTASEHLEEGDNNEVGEYPPKKKKVRLDNEPGNTSGGAGIVPAATATAKPTQSRSTAGSVAKPQQWWGNYSRLEYEHSFIQWLFPIQEGGGMSSTSQPLQKHEIKWMAMDRAIQFRIRTSYELMLDFFGMKLLDPETGTLGRSEHFADRYDNLNTSSHNYLRITRILKCLGEMGLEKYKLPFLKLVLAEMYVHGKLGNCYSSCRDYWMRTLRDEADRAALAHYHEALAAEYPEPKPSYSYQSYSWKLSSATGTGTGKLWWQMSSEEEDGMHSDSVTPNTTGTQAAPVAATTAPSSTPSNSNANARPGMHRMHSDPCSSDIPTPTSGTSYTFQDQRTYTVSEENMLRPVDENDAAGM